MLRLIDRDIVEEHNLSTQMLYDECDVSDVVPKSIAAARHLSAINSNSTFEAQAAELTPANAAKLLGGVDLILDATDNFEARFLINDVALSLDIPWIYTGALAYTGLCMPIIPGKTACLRCLMEEPPEAGKLPTCENVGVWLPMVQAIVAVGTTYALRMLTGQPSEIALHELDFQTWQWRKVQVARRVDCPACEQRNFKFLQGQTGMQATKLCGRDMVHLSPEMEVHINLRVLANKLAADLLVKVSEDLLQLHLPEAEIYLFPDGRAFVKGISDTTRARALYNRYISS